MKSEFQPESDQSRRSTKRIDPDAYDADGMQSAASMDEHQQNPEAEKGQASFFQSPDTAAWRQEVTARVRKYQARKQPKEPRFPSLFLKFDSGEPREEDIPAISAPVTREALAVQRSLPETKSPMDEAEPIVDSAIFDAAEEAFNKIIEFPRPVAAFPRSYFDELAERILDRPRIIEAPELVSSPALGGITIEPEEELEPAQRPGIDIPLQSAPLFRRFLGIVVDALIVLSGSALFTYIFLQVAHATLSWRQEAAMSVTVVGVLWIAYQYLLLVYSGTTPGLRIAKLRLECFDGSPAPRRLRRWRVLASVLSTVSLGLGYAWCFLDEDALCWHDRITRTYTAPSAETPVAEEIQNFIPE